MEKNLRTYKPHLTVSINGKGVLDIDTVKGGRMENLLTETRQAIKENGRFIGDINFIGSEGGGCSCSWNEFTVLANQEYNPSWGSAEVASDLIIVFSDGAVMRRGEYDGSEWWDFYAPFKLPKETKPITSLFAGTLWDDE